MGDHRCCNYNSLVHTYIWCVGNMCHQEIFTQPIAFLGLGCRTASNILYGILATLIWAMLVLSSILAYHSTRISTSEILSRSARICRSLSILLRRIGKFIATVNAIWIVLSSIFQFSNVFDRCWCNSSVIGLHRKAYTIIDYSHFDLTGTKAAWISGMALAAVTAFTFILSINSLAPSRQ